jgi:hypothetical protein
MPTPAAIAAAAAKLFMFILRVSPDFTTLATSCSGGSAHNDVTVLPLRIVTSSKSTGETHL